MKDHRQQEQVLSRLARLRAATGGLVSHKPLLLLGVLELAERGELPEVLELTPQVAFRFCSYFSIVAYRRGTRPDIRLPFHRLVSDGIRTPSSDSNRKAPPLYTVIEMVIIGSPSQAATQLTPPPTRTS